MVSAPVPPVKTSARLVAVFFLFALALYRQGLATWVCLAKVLTSGGRFVGLRLNDDLLSSIIGDIYDCAINPSGWSAALSRITLALDAAYTTISLASTSDNRGRMAAQSPWDSEQLRILNDDYGIDGVPGLKIVLGNDVDTTWSTLTSMPEDEFQQTPFYRNWARPQGLRDACLVKFVHTPDRIGIMGCITRANRNIIGREEQKFVALLSPHLRRAALIGDLLDQSRVEAQAYQSALNSLAVAVVLTDANGRILYANSPAEDMFRREGPVARAGGHLKAQFAPSQNALKAALNGASNSDQLLGGRGIGIPLNSPDHPAAVAYVLPLSAGTARAAFKPATAAVFVSTRISAAPLPEAVLIALYDLTPAEARVMLAVIGDQQKTVVLKQLQISENTLKTHLGHIYKKTGTNGHVGLVKLAASLSVPVRTSAT
jgi:DNA-binding CsgD family transcriptional regulator/PAS domain-containing protein